MDKKLQQMQAGFHTAFIDYSQNSEPGYRPQFISNDYKEGRKVIASIEQELKRCDEFFISVAFITEGDSQRAGGEERERPDTDYQLSEFQRA